MPEPPGASRSSVRAPLSKHSAPARDASRVLRARLYPHVAAELLSVPPPHSAAELSGSAEPAPEPAQTRSQCAALLVDYATDDFEAPPLVNASSSSESESDSSESECEFEDSPRAQKHSTRPARARKQATAGKVTARAAHGLPPVTSKPSARARDASRPPCAGLYSHAAADLLFVPPAHSAAELLFAPPCDPE